METMNENNFKKALSDSLKAEYDKFVSVTDDEHTFSPEFEKKMNKLINRRKKPYYKIINTVGKRVACIAIAFIVASSITVMSVEALRKKFIGFFIKTEKTHSTIRSEDTTNCPETIEDIYGITYDLSGYSIEYEDYNLIDRQIAYQNEDIYILFGQHAKPEYDEDVNTEDAEIMEISINDHEGIYFHENHDYDSIIWDNGDYIFTLFSNIGKDELIKIAESVQKVEK